MAATQIINAMTGDRLVKSDSNLMLLAKRLH